MIRSNVKLVLIVALVFFGSLGIVFLLGGLPGMMTMVLPS